MSWCATNCGFNLQLLNDQNHNNSSYKTPRSELHAPKVIHPQIQVTDIHASNCCQIHPEIQVTNIPNYNN